MKKSAVILLGLIVCGMGIIEAGWKFTGTPLTSIPAPAARNYGAVWFDSTNSALQLSTDAGLRQIVAGPILYDVFRIGGVSAVATYGGDITLDRVTPIRLGFRVAASGIGGTTGQNFRISNGTLNCDFGLPCNSAVGVYSLDAGNPSTGCSFATGDTLTYAVTATGDCATPLNIQDVKVRALRR